MSILKRTQQWATFARTWHIYDCTWQNPFDSAKVVKNHLMGLHKPIYHPMNDCGDHVVLINTGEIALPGDEWIKRVYFHHTGYPGGASWTLAWQLHEKDPTMVMKKAVYAAMKGNLQRRHTMQRLHLFPDDKVPEEILGNVTSQIKQTRVVPKRLDHIDKETLENFPAIMDYPKDYVLRCDPVFAGVKPKKSSKSKEFRNMGRLGKVDPSSFAEVEKITTIHSDLKWKVDFDKKKIVGSVVHKFNVLEKNLPSIFLDVSEINVIDAFVVSKGGELPINFFISENVPDIGSKLTLELPEGTNVGELIVKINYETSSSASALQWLTKEQTLGKEHPYLFSQCQAIHARSVIPCQDSPSVKFTYNAIVEHPKELTALMSAIIKSSDNGVTNFEQTIPIPAYLLAIAIGKLVSRPLGPNSNVWAEEGIIEDCAFEFSETSHMLKTAEEICGPYVWKQYDLLVMPPSFPFGGMENPCLTFVTPTLLAGDKSLADVVAHEIAHSWTGNFVTNRNFEHFWLNEGFTVFVENKIVGRLKGPKEQAFHMIRNITDLQECLRSQLSKTPELTKLIVDLSNCGPDDAFSSVPYIKGSTFLQYIEETLGGPEVFEPFLRSYLKKYAYKSILTNDFKETLYEYFVTTAEDKLNKIDWDKWLFSEGMPPIIPHHDDSLAAVCKHLSELWSSKTSAELKTISDITKPLSAHQIIDFLGKLIESSEIVDLNEEKINLLEKTYSLNATKNAEIRFRFMRLCIRARLMGRMGEIIEFANSNFRMKFVRPVYRDLAGWPEGKPVAVENFQKIKDQMMKVCQYTIEKDLGL